MWKNEDKSILNFDPTIIDAYLKEVEKSYTAETTEVSENNA